MNEITGTAVYYRENGHWHVLLQAPVWVISDIKRDLHAKGNVITIGNYCGASMLLVAASWETRNAETEQEAIA